MKLSEKEYQKQYYLKNKENIKLKKKQLKDQNKVNEKAFNDLPSFEQRVRKRAFKKAIKEYEGYNGKKPSKSAIKRLKAKWL